MEPLLDGEASAGEHRTTRARWWILGVYCLLAICQSCTWNVFGPIFPATYLAFPTWTPTFLNWVINTANIFLNIFARKICLPCSQVCSMGGQAQR